MRRAWFAVAALAIACGRPKAREIAMPNLDSPVAARSTPDDEFRRKPPTGSFEGSIAIPKIEERRLKNGIRVLFVERHDAPVISMRIVSDRGGDQADPGIAEFWDRAALMASESRHFWEVNEQVNALGMSLSADVTHDETRVSMRVLSKLFPAATELLADLIAHPLFPDGRLALVRQRMRASLVDVYGKPEGQVAVAAHRLLFPPMHRYHHALAPADSIDKVNADILRAYQRFAFTPAHMTLAVAGDTTIDALLPLLEKQFGALDGPKVGAQLPPPPPPDVDTEPRFTVIDQATGSQAHVAVFWLAPPIDTPDRLPFLVAADLFEVAINEELRVKRGITYGVQPLGDVMRGRSPFGAMSSVEIDRVDDAARVIVEHAEKLGTGLLITEKALADAKTSLIGSRAYFEGIERTAASLAAFAVYGYPLDYPSVRAKAINAATAEDVRQAAQKWLPLSRMRIVVVGDAAKVVPKLQKLGLGTIIKRSPYGP